MLSLSTGLLRSCASTSLVEISCTRRLPLPITRPVTHRLRHTTPIHFRFQSSAANSNDSPNRVYSFEDVGSSRAFRHFSLSLRRSLMLTPACNMQVESLTASPSADRILIDVREPAELQSTGRIPGAQNLPINSSPDGLFLPAEDFEDKFGFPKPRASDEVIFYCKSGVRSRSAAGLARMAGWQKVGEYPGSWKEWEAKGGKAEAS